MVAPKEIPEDDAKSGPRIVLVRLRLSQSQLESSVTITTCLAVAEHRV